MLTAANQSVTHDAKGNMTLIPGGLRPTNSGLSPTASRLTWDFENKLIAADTDNDSMDDVFYKFDALGRRVGRDDGTTNVVYFQDGQQTVADYPSGTAAGSPTYTYVYASYIDEPVMRGGSDGLRYYHRNQQYSITAVSDGGGSVVGRYAYSAYGKVTIADASGSVISNSAIANRYTYTGREWDEGLSLYHYRARMYDAVGGRLVSRDPIAYRGSNWGLYEFVSSTPLVNMDPSGLIDWGSWGGCFKNGSGGPKTVARVDEETGEWIYQTVPAGDATELDQDIDYVWHNGQWWKINQRNDLLRGGSLKDTCCVVLGATLTWECCGWQDDWENSPYCDWNQIGLTKKWVCTSSPYLRRDVSPRTQPGGGNPPPTVVPDYPAWTSSEPEVDGVSGADDPQRPEEVNGISY